MKLFSQIACTLAMAMACAVVQAATRPDLTPYVTPDAFSNLKLSPTGAYVGSVLRHGARSMLVVLDPKTRTQVGGLKFSGETQVFDFWWVSDKRLVVSLGETFGTRDTPSPTGELYGVNFDGSAAGMLVGYRVAGPAIGTRFSSHADVGLVAAELLDTLKGDDDNVLVTIWPLDRKDPTTRVERMNVTTGKRTFVASVPVRRASFLTDNHARVRFAVGADADNISKLYYRRNDDAEWSLENDESTSGVVETPVGFSRDDSIAYLRVEQKEGPDRIIAFDVSSGQRKEVASDPTIDPRVLYRNGADDVIGAQFVQAAPRTVLFDAADPDAQLQRKLEQAFKGQVARVASSTNDGRRKLVYVYSDTDPGSYYFFDVAASKADFYLASQEKIDVEKMSPMRSFDFTARDGMKLHGYITLPKNAKGPVPLVVMPHGGPFDIADKWAFDNDAQLLAEAGYGVLQVNFRGSGDYGRAYLHAGAREWGGKMQDDVTDATQWAIKSGQVDPKRICIYGASYGAYAALVGVAKEPGLYRCAVGYAGVYDLKLMTSEGDGKAKSSRTWLREWVGDDDARLAAASPTNMADRIKAPVFLAAGGEDPVAPIKHSQAMEKALRRANVPVETLYYPNEGHGFFTTEHQRAFYEHLLDFLDKHIGAGG